MVKQKLNITQTRDGLFFYIDGCLQFSSQDEHIYHEMLVHPAAGILDKRGLAPWRALILGGGDGLALREVLRYERCAGVELVDHDEDVISHAKTTFSKINHRALCDERVSVRIEDAWSYLERDHTLHDLIVADFTYPDTVAGARFFTADFFRRIKEHLHEHGLFGMNAFSPTRHPIAYWSVFKTLAEAGMHPRPVQVPLPTFLAQGFGKWGFFLASPTNIGTRELRGWKPTVRARFVRRARLLESLRFPADAVWTSLQLGNGLETPSDLLCLLGLPPALVQHSESVIDFSGAEPLKELFLLARAGNLPVQLDQDWVAKLVAILRSIDLDRLFEEVGRRIQKLSDTLQEQFRRLRRELPAMLKEQVLNLERAGQLISMLMLIIIFVNLIYPDSAFAKGSSSGQPAEDQQQFFMVSPATAPTPFHVKQLQIGTLLYAVNMKGQTFSRKQVITEANVRNPAQEEVFYSVTDEIFLTPSGKAYLFSPAFAPYYYWLQPEGFTLIREGSNAPIMTFAPDEETVRLLRENLSLQVAALNKTLDDYRKWNDWTIPSRYISEELDKESLEILHLQEIHSAMMAVLSAFKEYSPGDSIPPSRSHKLAPGVYVLTGGRILLKPADRGWGLYPWGKAAGTTGTAGTTDIAGLPLLRQVGGMDDFLNEMAIHGKDKGIDPAIVQLLNEIKRSSTRGGFQQ